MWTAISTFLEPYQHALARMLREKVKLKEIPELRRFKKCSHTNDIDRSHCGEPPVAGTRQHPWPRPGWKKSYQQGWASAQILNL